MANIMQLRVPARLLATQQHMENFSDLAGRTVVMAKGIFSTPLDFHVPLTVTLGGIDDLVLVVEQDYYLEKILKAKLAFIYQEVDLLEATCRLVEIYLSASPYLKSSEDAKKACRFALSNLNLL